MEQDRTLDGRPRRGRKRVCHANRGTAEAVGLALYRRAGLSPAAPVRGGCATLAVGLYGGDVIRESDRVAESRPARVNGKHKIIIRPRLPGRLLNVAIARAIARIETGREDEDLARFILAPTEAFRRTVALEGFDDFDDLARPFAIPEVLAAVRLVEVGASDGVVVTPARVYRPGRLLSWADDETIRGLAYGKPRSVRKVELDEPGCVALFAKC